MAIKRNLNLKGLKNDTLPKHKVIYDKAMYIMGKGYHSPNLSYIELKMITDNFRKHGLRASVAISGDITVRSKCSDWIVIDEGRFYVLYHEVTVVGANGKPQKLVHVQDVYEDLEYLLASIVTHDNFLMGNSDSIEIIDVLNEVKTLENLDYNVSNYAC